MTEMTSSSPNAFEEADPLRDLDEHGQLDERQHDEEEDEHKTHGSMVPARSPSYSSLCRAGDRRYASRISRRCRPSLTARAWSVRRSSMRSS